MEKGQARGRDTRVMLPVFSCIYMMAALLFLPWYSVPQLRYAGFPKGYTLWKVEKCLENIDLCVKNGTWKITPFSPGEKAEILKYVSALRGCAVILVVLLGIGAVLAFWKRKKSTLYMRILFVLSGLFSAGAIFCGFRGNILLNSKLGKEISLRSMTVESSMQLTSYAYAMLFLAVILFFAVGSLLDTEKEYAPPVYIERTVKEDKSLGKRTKLSILIILLGIPAVICFGILFLNDRSSVFIGMCIIILAMLPFLMVFEDRAPQAREILLIAVMASLAVVGRMAFFMLPQFKPVTAIVIITGVSLGAEAGFLTGAVAGFVSNFFFGQGPWTPWQMFAFGIIGFLAGILFSRRKESPGRIELCIFGGVAAFGIYGFIVDCSSVLNFSKGVSLKALGAMLLSGIPFNFMHGLSTIIFLWFLEKPMCRKLGRIKKKYGIMEQ